MRVLHVQKATGIAGSERHLLTLLPALARRGHDVSAAVLVAGSGEDFVARLRAAGVPTVAIGAGPHLNPVVVARLLGVVRKVRPDIVHTHLIHADLYGQVAARLAAVPGVSSVHGVAGPYRREPWRSAAAVGGHLARATIAISEHAATVVKERHLAPEGRVSVVHYGVDLDHWHVPSADEVERHRAGLGLGPGDVAVVVASRLVAHKGHDFLLQGLERAADTCAGLRLLIAGEGPLRPILEAQAASLRAGARVSFAGFLDDVRPLLAVADVVAFPTMPAIGEGFGLVVLEAMAIGRSVLATNVASLPEIVVHGETGILVTPGDVGAMADALVRLAGDAALRRRLGAHGRRRAEEHFGVDLMVERVMAVYEEVLDREGSAWPAVTGGREGQRDGRSQMCDHPLGHEPASVGRTVAQPMSVSVIIPHYGSAGLLWRCLSALERSTDMPYELVLVDNGTGEPDLPGTVIENDTNLGFARACNQGARAAQGECLVFLNNDTQPKEHWLGELVRGLDDPNVAVVGCKLVYPSGEIQHAGTVIVADDQGRLRGFNETTDLRRRYVSAVTAAAMLIRREVFEAVGGFDEGYWNSHEDVDLCLRVGEAGWKILYEPDAVVVHQESASGPERFSGIVAARARFHELWGDKVQPARRLPPPPLRHRLARRLRGA